MREPLVTVIVLNWNGKDDVIECLQSLEKQVYRTFEVVVVDNGSTDGSQAAIRQDFPAVTLIENIANLGFSEGNNVGIRYALEQGADYVLLLNNDTTVDEKLLTELVQAAESDDRIGAAGPKTYFYDAPQTLWAAGGLICFGVDAVRMRGWNRLDTGQYDDTLEVDYVPGCGLLAKAATIQDVGLLDPEYFAYYEDADWCLRTRQRGYSIHYVKTARMWHKASRTTGRYSPQSRYALGINSVVFVKKHASWHQWLKWFVLTAFSLPFLYTVRASQGMHKSVYAKARGIWDGFRGMRVTSETFQQQW